MDRPSYMGGDISNQVYDNNGYGGMAYYTSETCGYVEGSYVSTGCTNTYASSEIKYVVDAWAQAKVPTGLKEARLITYDELIDNLGYDPTISSAGIPQVNDNVPSWVYNINYSYWTMSQYNDSASIVWGVNDYGYLYRGYVGNSYDTAVRPVITLKKSALN